jgi:hypothetical protein
MKSIGYAALGAAALFTSGMAIVTPAEAKRCIMAGGQGTGLTPDLARTMAAAALGQSIASYGLRAAGKISVSCDGNIIMATCSAKQRACK